MACNWGRKYCRYSYRRSAAVNLGNSVLGKTIDNREVDNLPLVNRDAYQLLNLTPGVQNVSNENSIGLPMEHVIINGASDNMVGQVTYYLDGGLNMTGVRNTGNVIPNPDALDQFAVETNNFGAQYGRTGAGVVSCSPSREPTRCTGPSSTSTRRPTSTPTHGSRRPRTSLAPQSLWCNGRRTRSEGQNILLRQLRRAARDQSGKLQHRRTGCAAARRQLL